MKPPLAIALAVLLLAGCGGGGGSSTVPGASGAKTLAKTVTGSAIISIPTAAGPAGSARLRYPQFVSPNASSVALSINGGATLYFDVSSTSTLCATVTGARNCTLTFGAPAGSDTFAFTIFAGAGGSGTQLASATDVQTVVAGQAFDFSVALNAAVGTVVANVTGDSNGDNCPGPPFDQSHATIIDEGCPGSGTLTLTVTDPSGATVTGTAPYATPISIAGNDPSLGASPSTITAPGQTVTVSYNGNAFGTGISDQIVVTLTVGSNTIPVDIPVRRSYLYVANSNAPFGTLPPGGGNVAVYAYGANGNPSPVRTYQGGATLIVSPIKPLVDETGNLYVLDNGIPGGPSSFDPTILVFGPTTATGTITAAPLRQIQHLASVGANSGCVDMAFDPTGQYIFVACGNQIDVFPITANGLASNVFSTELTDTNLSDQTGLAFDPSGDLFISDDSLNEIDIVASPLATTGVYHTVAASHSLSASGGAWPAAVSNVNLAVDDTGALYAPFMFLSSSADPVEDNQAELGIWRPSSLCNNCAPTATLTGTPFTTHAVTGIAMDPPGNVYVVNTFTNLISVFSNATVNGASTSNATPLRTIANTTTGGTGPYGMTVGP